MRLQRESCVYIVYLCREIVVNYSRTSLQLSHSSEIRALEGSGIVKMESGFVVILVTCVCPHRTPLRKQAHVTYRFFFSHKK